MTTIDQRALALQAEGPDEYPTGYYRHLAIIEIPRYSSITMGSTTFYQCEECSTRSTSRIVRSEDIEEHEAAHGHTS